MMTKVWCGLIGVAVCLGVANGRIAEVSQAITQGSENTVTFLLSITGVLCFWSGLMTVMERSGLADRVAGALRPILRLIFGKQAEDPVASRSLAANMTANLMGLANAATPAGLEAARRLHALGGEGEQASNGLIRLVVLNTASLQLIPTTVAAVRGSLGAANPYDILPAVWITSLFSVTMGLWTERMLEKAERGEKTKKTWKKLGKRCRSNAASSAYHGR